MIKYVIIINYETVSPFCKVFESLNDLAFFLMHNDFDGSCDVDIYEVEEKDHFIVK